MDYVFAPHLKEDRLLRRALRSRPDTEIIWTKQKSPGSNQRERVLRIDQLFGCLGNDTDITRPANNVFLVSHGSVRGSLTLHIADVDDDKKNESRLNYEILEKALAKGLGKIPGTMIGPQTKINLVACNVGKDRTLPFLNKLKEVFGGQVSVIAPKHLFTYWPIKGVGDIFNLSYDFELFVKNPFKGSTAREDLIQTLMNKNFELIPFSLVPTIPKKFWEKWLPKEIKSGRQKSMTYHWINFNPPLEYKVKNKKKEIKRKHYFDVVLDSSWHRIRFTVPNVSGDMKDSAKNRKAAEDYIKSKDRSKSSHPFPVFKRYGFSSNQELFDAFNWKITPNKKKKTLHVVLSRFLYAVTIPICEIVDPEDKDFNELIYNFYPYAKNTHGKLTENLDTTNSDLYQTV